MATAISFSPVWPLPLSSATKPNRGGSPLKICPKLMTSTRPALSISSLNKLRYPLPPKASVESAEFVVEPGTNVKFQRKVDVPGCPESLVLIGTGFRERVFAIIGVKVYAAAFYAKSSIDNILDAWKGKSVAAVLEDSSPFKSIYQAPLDKSLAIVLVRDVDGKTFWNALDDIISPRIKQPSAVDESALATFQSTFQGRDLKLGTSIFLTWTQHSHMLVSISLDGPPSKVDAKIESWNVTLALFDALFGDSPVSPTLKASVADGLAKVFN